MSAQNVVRLDTLPLQSLVQVKKNVEEQLNVFMNSFNGFRVLGNKYEDSRILVKNIKEQAKCGDALMIPLTTSLYVPGRLQNTDQYMIDLGTGYFIEQNAKQTQDFCQRKVAMLQKQATGLQAKMEESRSFLEKTSLMINKRALEQQKAQAELQKQQQKK